ncbi:DNA polymerase III subunit [Faecalispora anaeroviscerum]|uniref:DNA polymerase III subunit n=1 Tax=Faecalispora anaeroviscerum TaxID=2991836 RepID=UPI0024BA1022|nr:DNA polymerase III subunit [Faecalispora anaeroviscerum]
MIFEGFFGNDSLRQQLSLALEQDRLPHAVILEGPPGSGKRTLAGILARACVCTAQGERPCGVCPACVKAKAGSHPDIIVESGSGAARSFHVDAVRRVRSDAYIKPNEASRKVYCLFEAQTMSEQAQNALLKILEEPPEGILFLLTCPSASALLPTIRSRSLILTLEPREQAGEHPEVQALAAQILRELPLPDESAVLKTCAPLIQNRELLRLVLDRLTVLFRDAAVLRAGGTSLTRDLSAQELARQLTRDRLLALTELCIQTRRRIDQNANSTLLVTVFCAQLRAVAGY